MVEISWHRRETRRQTEKTNINLKPYPELGCERSHPTVIQKSAEGIAADGKRAVPNENKKRGIHHLNALLTKCSRKGAWRMSKVKWVVIAMTNACFDQLGLFLSGPRSA